MFDLKFFSYGMLWNNVFIEEVYILKYSIGVKLY